ncbi:MAG: dATP/dGTP pyrophosphohydrolase domain-containing protein [Bacteroidales bacterium]
MNTYDKMVAFAKKRFPKASADDHLLKIKEEVQEAIDNNKDISEFADILLALYAAAGKAGYKEAELKAAAEKKFKELRKRRWTCERVWDEENGWYNCYKHVKK